MRTNSLFFSRSPFRSVLFLFLSHTHSACRTLSRARLPLERDKQAHTAEAETTHPSHSRLSLSPSVFLSPSVWSRPLLCLPVCLSREVKRARGIVCGSHCEWMHCTCTISLDHYLSSFSFFFSLLEPHHSSPVIKYCSLNFCFFKTVFFTSLVFLFFVIDRFSTIHLFTFFFQS